MSFGSEIFEPYKALGFVGYGSILALHPAQPGGMSFIYTSIGKSFHVYDAMTFALKSVGPEFTSNITHIEPHTHNNQIVFVCCEGSTDIFIIKRRALIGVLRGHNKAVSHLLSLGPILVSVSAEEHRLITWDISDTETVEEVNLDSNSADYVDHRLINSVALPSDSYVTSVVHPPTYQDKVVLGTAEGHIDLINVRKGATVTNIYRFGPYKRAQSIQATQFESIIDVSQTEAHTQASPSVTCIACSTALDVVAIGLSDGQILVHNLKYDQTLFSFRHEPGPITALCFRTDGESSLVSTMKDEVAVWDLDKRRLRFTLASVHTGGVTAMTFLPRHPILFTLGNDNSLKAHIFDLEDGRSRILRSMSGHSRPPNQIRFYDPFGAFILTTSSDRTLRVTATRGSGQSSTEISQRLTEKHNATKLPKETLRMKPIVDYDTCFLRENDWSNIATCHDNDMNVLLWSMKNNAISYERIIPDKKTMERIKSGAQLAAKSVAISTCGHFVCVGRANGMVDKYNVQSTKYRGSFIDTSADNQQTAHNGPVFGIVVDGINKSLTSVGYDGKVKFWDFVKLNKLAELDMESPVSKLVPNENKTLAAVACDDFGVRVIDLSTHKLVRQFTGHSNTINDMVFTHDSRQLVTCSMDGSIRVFDMVSGLTVDWFQLSSPCTSLAMHPQGLFLTTTHIDSVGIFLWINKLKFGEVHLRAVDKAKYVVLPTTADHNEREDELQEGMRAKSILHHSRLRNHGAVRTATAAAKRLSSVVENELTQLDIKKQKLDFVTLSDVPKHVWRSLPNLDIIREKNKPVEPKQKLIAPFFLTTTQGPEPKFVKNTSEKTQIASDDLKALSHELGSDSFDADNALAAEAKRLFVPTENVTKQQDQKHPSAADAIIEAEDEDNVQDISDELQSTDGEISFEEEDDDDETGSEALAALQKSLGISEQSQHRKSLFEEYEEAKQSSKKATDSKKSAVAPSKKNEAKSEFSALMARMSNKMMAMASLIYSHANAENATKRDYDPVIEMLKGLPPAAIDVMVRTVSSRTEEMTIAIDMFVNLLEARRDFDFVQALLNLFLKVHSDVIISNEELVPLVQRLNEAQKSVWDHTENLFSTDTFLVRFLAKLPF